MGTISVKFQQIISEESIWMTSLTLKAFVMRPDNKGARKVINEEFPISNFKNSWVLNFVSLFQFDEGKQKAKPFFKSKHGPFYNSMMEDTCF